MPSSVEREYIVLRDMYRGAEPTGLWSTRDATGKPKPGAVKVTVETLNKRDTADLQQDPTVLGHAPPMEVRLVAPCAMAESKIPASGGASWGVSATGALKSPYTGEGITVAVLDTGIDARHEAFAGVELVQKDFTGEGNGDNNGHGTHCAGTILGRSKDGYRFGIAPGIKRALIGKVLDKHGSGSSGNIIKAILWALENGTQVISISIGLDFPGLVKRLVEFESVPTDLATSMALEEYRANVRLFDSVSDLIRAQAGLLGEEAIVVAAAGNESKRHIDPKYEIAVSPPANAVGFLSVGALEPTQQGKRFTVAYFSNTGPSVSAPGVDILSAKANGGYTLMSGTSMATPHVAGVAALWAEWLLKKTGRIKADEMIAKLKGQAATQKLARGVDTVDVGSGLVQAPID